MTFDARTAEPGSRWRCRNGYIEEFDRIIRGEGDATKEFAGFKRPSNSVQRFRELNGRMWSHEESEWDIIAPEPEAKPAVPEPAQGEDIGSDPCDVAALQYEYDKLRSDLASRDETIERLNQMIRDTGQGQGAIDAYVSQCEDMERKDETIKRLERELAKTKRRLIGHQDSIDVAIENLNRLQSDNARLTAELSAARERVTVLEGERDEAVEVIDGLLSFSGQPLCRWQHEWDDEVLKAQVILERRNIREAALSGSVEDA